MLGSSGGIPIRRREYSSFETNSSRHYADRQNRIAALQRHNAYDRDLLRTLLEAYAKASLKKYSPTAARNDDEKVASGLL